MSDDPATPFLTIDHVQNFNAVLVEQSRLGEISRAELDEVITDEWANRVLKTMAQKFFADD